MGIYQVLSLIGVPAFCFAGIGALHKRMKSIKRENEALMLGIQALLRDRLLQAYSFYTKQGFMTYDERANISNMYTQYHALGANGVMDNYYERMMSLPTQPNN